MRIDDMPAFVPGLKLCKDFYWEAVRPILDRHFPGLRHSAARLDYGSDVMGFDTAQSRDHAWGPKAMLFLEPQDHEKYKNEISSAMARELPLEFHGYPTNFDDPFSGEGLLVSIDKGPVNHWVAVTTIRMFFDEYLGVDPAPPIPEIEWLTLPQQHLRTVAAGQVYFDGLNQLQTACEHLRWYPQDIWLYLLSNQWRRIDQEEPFMARCGDVDDEFGSRLVAFRLVAELMKLCFLLEQQYLPYTKWWGTAFSRLANAPRLIPIFQQIFDSSDWQAREQQLSAAYQVAMDMHNALELTPFIEPKMVPFFNRPYKVPRAGRFVEALQAQIKSETVKTWPPFVGAIGQFVDSTDVKGNLELMQRLTPIYAE